MAIASDPSQRRRLLPKVIHRSKLRFLFLELFGEFSWYKWGSFEFYLNIIILVVALWLRIYIHYLAQYLFLRVREIVLVCCLFSLSLIVSRRRELLYTALYPTYLQYHSSICHHLSRYPRRLVQWLLVL